MKEIPRKALYSLALVPTNHDIDSFRSALGSFASSVTIISMWHDGVPLGMTATAFSAVSTDPQLILICVNRSTRTYEYIVEGKKFGINILGSVAQDLSDYCSRPGEDKSLVEDWLADNSSWNCPALAGAVAYLDCTVNQTIAAGTHAVIIAQVENIGLSDFSRDHEPLLYLRGKYRQLTSLNSYKQASPLPIILEDIS